MEMKQSELQKILDEFYERMTEAIQTEKTRALSDEEVEEILEVLRSNGAWNEKTDKTLESMIPKCGSKAKAFEVFSEGNPTINAIVSKKLAGEKIKPKTKEQTAGKKS
jgi:hypothetical protein